MDHEREPRPITLQTPGMKDVFLSVMQRNAAHEAEVADYSTHRLVVADPDSLVVTLADGSRRVQLPEFDPDAGKSYYAKPEQQQEETTPEQQAAWLAQGLELDTRGRPLHPLWREMLQAGALLGRGSHYYYGPNHTADLRISRSGRFGRAEKVAYGVRRTSHQTCEPGGYVEGEDAWATAMRETREELGLRVLARLRKLLYYQDVVADPRATIHSWNWTTAYAIRWPWWLPFRLKKLTRDDEMEQAGCTTQDGLKDLPPPFAMHDFLMFPAEHIEIPDELAQRASKLSIQGLKRVVRRQPSGTVR